MAGAVCVALKSVGMGQVNPGNQDLKNMLDAGADIGAFIDAGQQAVDRKKGFGYALGIVKRQLAERDQIATKGRPSRAETDWTASAL